MSNKCVKNAVISCIVDGNKLKPLIYPYGQTQQKTG